MGDFTTVDKVKSLFRRIKIEDDTGDEKTNTVITTEEVDEFIAEVESTMKVRLSNCYDTTSIGSESVVILGRVAKYKVAQIIKDIMEMTTSNSERKEQALTANWGKKAKELMDQICPIDDCGKCKNKPTLQLPDTDLLAEAPIGASIFSTASNTAQFKKNESNW